MRRLLLGLTCAAALCGTARRAEAWTVESIVSEGCHERITIDALQSVRKDLEIEAPSNPSRADLAFLSDVPFTFQPGTFDIATGALLVGIRDNDLKGRDPMDTPTLAEVHNGQPGQREHCLRRAPHDEPEGTPEALAACRAYIHEMLEHAVVNGFDCDAGEPDLDRRTLVDVQLAMAGSSSPDLPIFWVYLGRCGR